MTQDFESFCRSLGLRPGSVAADGRVRRCPTDDKPNHKNGAYMLATDGVFGWAQDHATMSEVAIWQANGKDPDGLPPPIDFEALRARRKEERRQLALATQAAREFYERCKALRGGHPYLEAHQLDMTGCEGLKVDSKGWLVVPALRGGKLLSVQRISPEGEKRFWPGASMKSVSYTVERAGASITVLCEGLATGLAIFAAAPLTRVVVAFTASNMVKVAESVAFRGFVTVAADNDHRTAEKIGRNPGIQAAEEAAKILGCGVMVPTDIEGSDWCDLRNERLQARLEKPFYKRQETESAMRKAVDAEIAREVQKHAVFKSLV